MKYDDLPPALRAQADAQLGKQAKKRTTRKGDVLSGVAGWCRCGERFEGRGAWKRFEAHSEESGHRRFEVIR